MPDEEYFQSTHRTNEAVLRSLRNVFRGRQQSTSIVASGRATFYVDIVLETRTRLPEQSLRFEELEPSNHSRTVVSHHDRMSTGLQRQHLGK